ncbi:hypothetical protein [Sporosarcina sp. SAFN-010]|uniref:phage tail protein n=1 Tax=Sporosarcina sp. SAFN-010 TaxID=3387273 RepID=UPI003F7DA9E2
MIENFQAIIGAKINDFNRKMKQVDKKVRETAFEATKPIGANIREFQAKMKAVQATTKRVLKRDDKTISADISRFLRKAAEVAVVARALTRDNIVIPIRATWKNYQNTMRAIATFSRNMSEIMQMTARGIMISLSPAVVPIIASVVGLLGQLGPMLGTIAGSTFALGTAFATAGIGAAGFGAIAVTNLKDVFGASSDLKKLQEKLDDATDLKERNKILKEMQAIQGSLNSEQTKALTSMNKLKDTWSGIAKGLETKTIQIFTQSLDMFGSVLTSLTPMFAGVTDAVGRLTSSLGQTIKSDSMKAFFDYLNKSAGPMLETITKAAGNFIQGFLNMMVAFGPLAEDTAAGFLRMSEGFAEWSSKLGESAKFQAFVDYVNENMPKIRSIFSDAIQGMINMFAAFAPSSADMMTSLQDMMERFKEWSSTLAENQSFQNFINYIKENGPQVVSLIGNITTFLVNLGIALAPIGQTMLGLINRFLEWSSAMMENHPWVGKIIAAVVVFGGAMLAALPHVIGLIAAIGTLATPIGAAQVSILSMAATFIAKTSAMVANTVKSVATIIGRWALMAAQSAIHAAKVAASWTLATGAKMVTAVAKMVASAATFVGKWLLMATKATASATKQAAAWTLSTGAAMAKSVANMTRTAVLFVAKWVLMGAQALAQAARMAAAWLLALGPVGWVIATVVGLAALIIANWSKIKAKTVEIWNNISNAVKNAWTAVKQKTVEAVVALGKEIGKIPGKVLEFRSQMLSAGKDLVMGLINGIKNMAKDAIGAITGVVSGVVNKAKSLLKIHSPSRVFISIGEFVGKGMAIGVSATRKANEKAIQGVTAAVTAVAKKHASELLKIDADARKDRAAVQKDSAKKEHELERKAAQSIQSIHTGAATKKRKLTASEALRIRNIKKDLAVNIQKIEEDSNKKIASINAKAKSEKTKTESSLAKERLDVIKQFIDDKKSTEELSLVAEAKVWEASIKLFKNGTKEKVEAQKAYKNAVQAVNNEITAINQEYSDKMQKINDELAQSEKQLNEEYSKAYSDRIKDIKNFAGLFDEFVSSFEGSGQTLLNNLQNQVTGLQDWRTVLDSLWGKIDDKDLMKELEAMGPKALGELQALNTLSAAELNKYTALYQQKTAIAVDQATLELADLKANTTLRIEEMRAAANKELDVLKTEWVAKIGTVTKATDTQLQTLKQVGVNAGKGLMNGLASMEGALVAKATSIANAVKAAMASALDIHSPSRWMRDMIGKNMMFGWIDGMEAMKSKVVAMSAQSTEWMKPNLADLRMAPLDTQTQMTALKRQIKQELNVDMSVNHSGSVGAGVGGGFNQEVHLHSPKALSPSENARALAQVGRQQALAWNGGS